MMCTLDLIADLYINPCQVVYVTPKDANCIIVTTVETLEFARPCEELARALKQ